MKDIIIAIVCAKAATTFASFLWKALCPKAYHWISYNTRLTNDFAGNLYIQGGKYHGIRVLPSAINPFR